MKIADIILLSKLFCEKKDAVLFYTNQNISSTEEIHIFDSESNILQFLAQNQHEHFIIFSEMSSFNFLFKTKNVKGVFQFQKAEKTDNAIFKSKTYYYINNRDETIRWIFPSESKSPTFLSLYNSAGLKATIYKIGIKASFLFKAQRLFSSGRFTFFYKNELLLDKILSHDCSDFSIFTGTVGANTKMLFPIKNNKNVSHFLKFPTSKKAVKLLENEYHQIKYLEQFNFKTFTIPSVQKQEKGILISNIKPKNRVKNTKINDKHLETLSEIYDKTFENAKLTELNIYQEIVHNLLKIKAIKYSINNLSIEKIHLLARNLEKLFRVLSKCENLNVAVAHKDFTPWNMYADNTKLYIYDWELAEKNIPLLFDAFHFIFQTNVLIKRQNYIFVKSEIEELKQRDIVKKIVNKYGINLNWSHLFYVVYTASYYLNLYAKQENLHIQAHWLIDVWIAATQDFIDNKLELETPKKQHINTL